MTKNDIFVKIFTNTPYIQSYREMNCYYCFYNVFPLRLNLFLMNLIVFMILRLQLYQEQALCFNMISSITILIWIHWVRIHMITGILLSIWQYVFESSRSFTNFLIEIVHLSYREFQWEFHQCLHFSLKCDWIDKNYKT